VAFLDGASVDGRRRRVLGRAAASVGAGVVGAGARELGDAEDRGAAREDRARDEEMDAPHRNAAVSVRLARPGSTRTELPVRACGEGEVKKRRAPAATRAPPAMNPTVE